MTVRFPDVQKVLVATLQPLAGGVTHTGTATPPNLAEVLPFVRVRRVDGPRDRVNDYAQVEVDVFAAAYAAGEPLAEAIAQFLSTARAVSPLLDRIECDTAFRELPHGNGVVRRWGATFTVVSRRRQVA